MVTGGLVEGQEGTNTKEGMDIRPPFEVMKNFGTRFTIFVNMLWPLNCTYLND